MSTLFRDVEVEGARVDVRWSAGIVAAVAERLEPESGDDVVDGHGGALLPGLHDHHLHLFALAAARASVDVSGGLEPLRAAPGTGWVRGVGAAESWDRHALDRVAPDRPVRVQHRSGGLWVLNSVALVKVRPWLDGSADVERDEDGEPTGRLWRYDARLRAALPDRIPPLDDVVAELLRLGITSVTDATPDLDEPAARALAAQPLPVTVLGDPAGTAPRKLLLRDHDLPGLDDLAAVVAATHASGRPVAVHCVSREALVLTLAALGEVGRRPGDRIEHAAVVPPEAVAELRGLTVVTQPAFVVTRAAAYRRDVDPRDLPLLYPYARLLEAGVDVLPSSDAPYGPLDPWEVVRAATGRELGPGERVPAEVALRGYLCGPTGDERRVRPGTTTGLVLMGAPLTGVLAEPSAEHVQMAVASGLPSVR